MNLSNYSIIKLVVLFLLTNLGITENCFSRTNHLSDSIVKLHGYVYDTISESPDTLLLKAKIVLESIPHGSEIGIISSSDSGYYEYYVNLANNYRIAVYTEKHKRYTEILSKALPMNENGIRRDYYLEPDLKENQVIRLNKLIFEQGKANITTESYTVLNRLVRIMNENPSMQIQLEGHTDYRGSKRLNMNLSQDRVFAVKSYLVARGIIARRIRTKAYGGTRPLTKEPSLEASKINRRVEVRILRLDHK